MARWRLQGIASLGILAVMVAAGVGGLADRFSSTVLLAISAVTLILAGATLLGLILRAGREARNATDIGASLARIEAVLASQPGLTLVLDTEGRALAAYGSAPTALPVDPLFEIGLIEAVHQPDRPAVLTALARAVSGAEVQVRFAPRMALDRRILLSVRRQVTVSDEPIRLIALALDATRQHAREEELEAARVEADAQNASKSHFLANMSHELRTPLNAVLGFSDIMRQRLFGPIPDRYGHYAELIYEAGGHLLDLINDVLDVSRIEAARYELNIEIFDVRDVVSSALALVRAQADDKDVELSAVLSAEAVSVSADRRALKQIALNLLSNAVKFTPSGGSVTISALAVAQNLELTVADTGIGVAPEDLARLGRPFEQAGDAEQRAQGTGLGLSLVRSLAELHKGTMSIDSTPGAGTAVTVRLPVVTDQGAAGDNLPANDAPASVSRSA